MLYRVRWGRSIHFSFSLNNNKWRDVREDAILNLETWIVKITTKNGIFQLIIYAFGITWKKDYPPECALLYNHLAQECAV